MTDSIAVTNTPNAGAFTSSSVNPIPGATHIRKPIEEIQGAPCDENCNYMSCTCKSGILECKTANDEDKTKGIYTVRFVGVTDAASNGQKFDPLYMKSIVDEGNKKIDAWKKGTSTDGIFLYDKSNHQPEAHGEMIGWVDQLIYHKSDTSARQSVHWIEVIGKTFQSGFNKMLELWNQGIHLIRGWSIGFKHPSPDSYDYIDGVKSTKQANIVHWVASLDPADPWGNRTLDVSKSQNQVRSKIENKGENADNIVEKTKGVEKEMVDAKPKEGDKAEEEEELYVKKGGEFVKVTKKAKGEEEEKKKGEEEEEKKLAKKSAELDEREITLNLDVLVKTNKLTPAEKDEWKAILTKTAPEARAGIYAMLEKKTAVIADKATEQQLPMQTKTAAQQEGDLQHKGNPNERVEQVKSKLRAGGADERMLGRLGKNPVKFDELTGKRIRTVN